MKLIFFFYFSAAIFILGGIFHLMEIVRFGFTGRHALFIFVNFLFSFLCFKRPKFFHYAVSILTVQQFYSHGGSLIANWNIPGPTDWNSIGVCLFFPLLLWASFKAKNLVP